MAHRRWPAFVQMRTTLHEQLQVLPLLRCLHSSTVRDRHWREVMNVPGVTFPLEGLTLRTLLPLGLQDHSNKLRELTRIAAGEASLETSLSQIQSDWNEHTFTFEMVHPGHGHGVSPPGSGDGASSGTMMVLAHEPTQRLIEAAEHSHMHMATMMTSPSLGPHRGELVAWMAKLLEISGFLARWLGIQRLWLELHNMSRVEQAELTTLIAGLATVENDYLQFVGQAKEVGNILQFWYGSTAELPKSAILLSFLERLEGERQGLRQFFDQKRRLFPRLYFVSDAVLLGILSESPTLARPKTKILPLVMDNVARLVLEERSAASRYNGQPPPPQHPGAKPVGGAVAIGGGQWATCFPDAEKETHIIAVESREGELLLLQQSVAITAQTAHWLASLLEAIKDAVRGGIVDAARTIYRQHDMGSGSQTGYTELPYEDSSAVTQVVLASFRLQFTAGP